MKDKEEDPHIVDRNDAIGRNSKEDDDYIFTEDQRQAALELQSLYRQLGLEEFDDGFEDSFSVYEDPSLDIKEKLRDVNAKFDSDQTPIESDRTRKVRFKETLVDLVVPISPLRDSSTTSYYDFEDLVSSSEEEDGPMGESQCTVTPTITADDLLDQGNESDEVPDVDSEKPKDSPTVDKTAQEIPVEVPSENDEVPSVASLQLSEVESHPRPNPKPTRKVNSKSNSKSNGGSRASRGSKTIETQEKMMPSYKGNSRSPYGVPDEVKKELKMLRQAEAQQKRQKDESKSEAKDKRKEEAERAYSAWLENKGGHARRSHSASPTRKNHSTQKRQATSGESPDTEEALRAWLEHKEYQENRERILSRLVQQEKSMMLQRSKKEDSKRAYRAWLKKKKAERQQIPSVPQYQQHSSLQADVLRRTFRAYFGSTL